ncbi:MAG: hypothetical protein ACI8W8_004724 [Rhodothermales bacterium]|jgi:hypothetical protein
MRRASFALLLTGICMAEPLSSNVSRFVREYCVDCHNPEKEKGDRSFHDFLAKPDDQHEILEEILDQLNLGEMPPDKKSVRQASNSERQRVSAQIARYLSSAESNSIASAAVLRRLTRHEYKNSIRDLLGVHPDASDATMLFPVDARHHGFATVGAHQALSDYQLRQYIAAARYYLDQALVFGEPAPERKRWDFAPADFSASGPISGGVIYRVLDAQKRHVDIGHGEPVDRAPTYPDRFSRSGVPRDGHYRIRVTTSAVGRKHPYGKDIYRCDLGSPLKLGLWHVPNNRLLQRGASEGRIFVQAYDLPDNEPITVEATVWMPAGSTPFVHWINGEGPSKRSLALVRQRHHPEIKFHDFTQLDKRRKAGTPKAYLSDVYQGPRVRLFGMSIEGPLDDWPPPGHRAIVGDTTETDQVDIPATLIAFASRAFRRPVQAVEIAHHISFVQERITEGTPHADALKLGLSAILSSPRFLFLDEGNPEADPQLDAYEIASRLSYMLWSSIPDDELLALAASGKLRTPQVRMSQARRMLADPRAEAFDRYFTEAWLGLNALGAMPPSNAQYPAYYSSRLESAMKTETRLFFREVRKQNHPITDFISSDYSYVNDSLARHYGLSGDFGERFQRVVFPAKHRRGGLLGHASVLSASANGVETSPVVRGVWVLERLLGTPPAPPPPDVPPIEPDTRGATTIREQLAKHRSVPACAECHAKIDPWGFALEFYDPIGGLRTHYAIFTGAGRIARQRTGKAIDGASSLPSGKEIHDESELKAVLLSRRNRVTERLAETLLIYATGRELTFRDQPEIKAMVERVAMEGYGMRDLILEVVASDIFARR